MSLRVSALKRLAQMADLMGKTLAKRLKVPEPKAAYFRHMKASLSHRKMAFGPTNLLMVAKPPLKRLYDGLNLASRGSRYNPLRIFASRAFL